MELNSQKKEKRGQNRKYSEKQWLKLTELVKVLSLKTEETRGPNRVNQKKSTPMYITLNV